MLTAACFFMRIFWHSANDLSIFSVNSAVWRRKFRGISRLGEVRERLGISQDLRMGWLNPHRERSAAPPTETVFVITNFGQAVASPDESEQKAVENNLKL